MDRALHSLCNPGRPVFSTLGEYLPQLMADQQRGHGQWSKFIVLCPYEVAKCEIRSSISGWCSQTIHSMCIMHHSCPYAILPLSVHQHQPFPVCMTTESCKVSEWKCTWLQWMKGLAVAAGRGHHRNLWQRQPWIELSEFLATAFNCEVHSNILGRRRCCCQPDSWLLFCALKEKIKNTWKGEKPWRGLALYWSEAFLFRKMHSWVLIFPFSDEETHMWTALSGTSKSQLIMTALSLQSWGLLSPFMVSWTSHCTNATYKYLSGFAFSDDLPPPFFILEAEAAHLAFGKTTSTKPPHY